MKLGSKLVVHSRVRYMYTHYNCEVMGSCCDEQCVIGDLRSFACQTTASYELVFTTPWPEEKQVENMVSKTLKTHRETLLSALKLRNS